MRILKTTQPERTSTSCLLLSHEIDYGATFCPEYLLFAYSLVFQSGPSSSSNSRGTGFPVPEPLASMPTKVTGLGVGKIIPGSSAPLTMEQKNNLPQGREGHPLSTKALATEKSSFGGVVTPVNV